MSSTAFGGVVRAGRAWGIAAQGVPARREGRSRARVRRSPTSSASGCSPATSTRCAVRGCSARCSRCRAATCCCSTSGSSSSRCRSYALVAPPPRPGRERSRDEVLRARRARVRPVVGRHLARLRHDRQAGTRRELPPASGRVGYERRCWRSASCSCVVGVAFEFGAVPFHMWMPDVYQGSPTAVTLFIAAAPENRRGRHGVPAARDGYRHWRQLAADPPRMLAAAVNGPRQRRRGSRRPISSGCSGIRPSRTSASC